MNNDWQHDLPRGEVIRIIGRLQQSGMAEPGKLTCSICEKPLFGRILFAFPDGPDRKSEHPALKIIGDPATRLDTALFAGKRPKTVRHKERFDLLFWCVECMRKSMDPVSLLGKLSSNEASV